MRMFLLCLFILGETWKQIARNEYLKVERGSWRTVNLPCNVRISEQLVFIQTHIFYNYLMRNGVNKYFFLNI